MWVSYERISKLVIVIVYHPIRRHIPEIDNSEKVIIMTVIPDSLQLSII